MSQQVWPREFWMSEPYWGIRFLALDETGADDVVAYGESLGFDGFTSDPYLAYEELFDRDGVLISMKLFEAALKSGSGLLPREETGAERHIAINLDHPSRERSTCLSGIYPGRLK